MALAGLAGIGGSPLKRSDAETKLVGLAMGVVIAAAVEISILSRIASDGPRGAKKNAIFNLSRVKIVPFVCKRSHQTRDQ